jgi:hypothetical protein
LTIENGVFVKESSVVEKIQAEYRWYVSLPLRLMPFTPAVYSLEISNTKASYTLEYLYLNSLAELFVFSKIHLNSWRSIFARCFDFIEQESLFKQPNSNSIDYDLELFENKTKNRLIAFGETSGYDLNKFIIINGVKFPSLNELRLILARYKILDNSLYSGIMHGDFCFSNIMYDFRSKSIKVIDPRGLHPNGEISSYGNVVYDIIKLAHSVVGLYDHIVFNRYNIEQISEQTYTFKIYTTNITDEIQSEFLYLIKSKFPDLFNILIPKIIQLFLAMLPLHKEDPKRQLAFIMNSYRLYNLMNHKLWSHSFIQ